MDRFKRNANKFCSTELLKVVLRIVSGYEQFPEAMCDMATSIVLKKKFKDRLTWKAGHVKSKGKRVPHFWIYDTKTALNIDLTAFQFDHIAEFLCTIDDKTFDACPFLIGSETDFEKLGYITATVGTPTASSCWLSLETLRDARSNYKTIRRE